MRCKSISEFIMCFMLSLFSLTAFAQIKITGTASDAETGEPLSFITIQIKGTTAGTTSDMDGNYSIEVPNRDAILVYSYIGYRSQEIKVGNQTHINVRLSEDVETLDEVVVVGYGVQNKRDVTGSNKLFRCRFTRACRWCTSNPNIGFGWLWCSHSSERYRFYYRWR